MKKFISFFIIALLSMQLSAQNKVGIGTSTPQQRLSVDSTLGIDQGNFDDGTKPALRFGSIGTGEAIGSRRIAGGINPFGIDFWTSSTKRMVISNGGNIGIGEQVPGFPLNFSSTLGDKISLYGNSGNSYGFGIQSNTFQIHGDGANADIVFGYGSSASFVEKMRIKGNGMVGIGTNSPIEQLHIYDTANTGFPLYIDSNNPSFSFMGVNSRNNTSGMGMAYYRNGIYKGANYLTAGNDYAIELAVGNIFFARSTNGFIGLGTTSPQQNLSVSDGMNIDQANLNSGTTVNSLTFGNLSGEGIGSKRTPSGNFDGLDFYTNFINRMAITNAGKIGIGLISPTSKLEVRAGGIGVSSSSKLWEMNYDSTNAYFYIDETGSARRFTIKNGGNVGIGTTNPTVPLDVAGDIKTTGSITVQTNKAIIRSNSSVQQKLITFAGPYATNLSPGAVSSGTIFYETFSGVPTVYVANVSGTGDIQKVMVTCTAVTTSSCTVNFYNPSSSIISFNGTFNFIAVGPQ